ncbi:DUF2130 domain-containing protein, partial [Mycoplasmopsis alligatoris]
MSQIKCPNCSQTFTVDENLYNKIVKQIRDDEFKHEINSILSEKELLIKNHYALKEKELTNKINLLNESIKVNQKDFELQKNNSLQEKENKIFELTSKLNSIEELSKNKTDSLLNEQKARLEHTYLMQISKQEKEIEILKNKESNFENAKKLALNEKETKIIELNNILLANQVNKELEIKKNEEIFKNQIKEKDDQISFLKDYKSKQSVKLLGESLEKHCEIEFNLLRATAFPYAYFEKDNDTSLDGTKGDYIFRDYSEQNIEYISIMFEMKNEQDESKNKKKNEDFFEKLNKDRNNKKCEYAVLVSTLESDSELYNKGIVDVSYRFPKMYVIRPQFFIPLISILRNSAQKSIAYKAQLEKFESQNVDVTNFEKNWINLKMILQLIIIVQKRFWRSYYLY